MLIKPLANLYTLVYNNTHYYKVSFTQAFEKWLSKLKDHRARLMIKNAITMIRGGNKSTQQRDIKKAQKLKEEYEN